MNPSKSLVCRCGDTNWINNWETCTVFCDSCKTLWTYEAIDKWNLMNPVQPSHPLSPSITSMNAIVKSIYENQIYEHLKAQPYADFMEGPPEPPPFSYRERAAAEFDGVEDADWGDGDSGLR